MRTAKTSKGGVSCALAAVLLFSCCGLGKFVVRSLAASGAFGGLSPKNDAFHKAVVLGNYAEVKRFLDAGKDPDAKGLDPRDEGGGALMSALLLEHYDIAELLVSHGADVNRIHHGKPLIYDFVRTNDMKSYDWLIRHGAKLDPKTQALLRLHPNRRWRF